MRSRVVAAWWLACLLWSGTFLFIKIGLADVPPFTFAAARLILAAAVLIPVALVTGGLRRMTGAEAVQVVGAGFVLLGVNYGLVYWGARLVPSGLVAILQSATPIIALALGWGLDSERVTARKVFALTAGVVGVALVFGAEARASGTAAVLGSVAILGSSACVAAVYVWLKGYGKRLTPTAVTALQCVAGIAALAPPALVLEGNPLHAGWTTAAVAAVLYLALCGSVLAFWLNYWLLARMDASTLLMMGVAEVPIAVALGAAILGERLPPGTLAGGTCVLLSILLGPLGRGDQAGNGTTLTGASSRIRHSPSASRRQTTT